MYREAAAGRERTLGLEHLSTLDTSTRLVEFMIDHGRLVEADDMCDALLRTCYNNRGLSDITTADMAYRLASIRQMQVFIDTGAMHPLA
jgi:hypothetical protein